MHAPTPGPQPETGRRLCIEIIFTIPLGTARVVSFSRVPNPSSPPLLPGVQRSLSVSPLRQEPFFPYVSHLNNPKTDATRTSQADNLPVSRILSGLQTVQASFFPTGVG